MSLLTGYAQDVPPQIPAEEQRRKELLDKLTATGRQGTKGRLVMNDCSFSVALFESDEKEGPSAVMLVDAEDSAAWFMWFGSQSPIIADHCTQHFDVIKDCKVGDVCYIVDGEEIQKYACVAVDSDGINTLHNLYLSSGYDILIENDPGYLYMYTCNRPGDFHHITIVTWVPIDEVDTPCLASRSASAGYTR